MLSIVVPEAVGPEVLGTEAGVGGRDEVFHPQALDPFGGKLGFAKRESERGGMTCFKSSDWILTFLHVDYALRMGKMLILFLCIAYATKVSSFFFTMLKKKKVKAKHFIRTLSSTSRILI